MKRLKKCLASFLVLVMLAGIFGDFIGKPFTVKADTTTPNAIDTYTSDSDEYTYLSFHDYRVEGENAIADNDWTNIPENLSSSVNAITSQFATLDKVVFGGSVTFSAEGQTVIIGGIYQTITGAEYNLKQGGMAFYITGGKLYLENKSYPSGGKKEICTASLNQALEFELQFDQLEPSKWKVSYNFNGNSGEITHTNNYGGNYVDFGPYLTLRVPSGTMTVVSSKNTNAPKVMEAASYDLADGDYLVSGTAVVKNAAGDTVLTTPCANPVLGTAGDYTITTTEGSFTREQKVSLYRVGYLDLDADCDTDDYNKLVELLQYSNENGTESYVRPYKADCAVEYAADLNNNGKVDRKDLDLIYSIVSSGTTTLDAVIDKYHVPSISYDYLGGKDVMPIVGFYGPYYGPLGQKTYNFLTDDIYKKISELGINLINDSVNQLGNNTGTRYVYKQLQLAEKYGIGQFISDATVNPELQKGADGKNTEVSDNAGYTIQSIAEQMGKYTFYGSYLGTYVRDEPLYYYSGTNVAENNRQLKYFDWIAKKMNQFTNNLGFINSVDAGSESEFATSSGNGVNNFKEGLEKIYTTTDAKLFSFTSYPFSYGLELGANDHDYSVTSGSYTRCNRHHEIDGHVCGPCKWLYYYRNLWDSRAVAEDTNKTFWAYTAAGGDFNRGKDDMQATDKASLPTEAETYWDVNNKLAFGAKGIEWFPLLQPWYFVLDNTKTDGYDYDRNGLINLKGEFTTFGGYAKDINQHIAAIDDVLMRSKSVGIMATGEQTRDHVTREYEAVQYSYPSKNKIVANTGKLLKGTTALSSVTGDEKDGYGALVGCFNYGDTEAFYVVNYHLTEKQTFTLNFNNEYNYRYVSDATDYTDVGTTLTLNDIEPGRGVLVVLDEDDVRYADGPNEVLQAETTSMVCSGKNLTFYTDSVESLYGSSAQDNISFAYDTDAVFLNGQPIRPTITEANENGLWGFALDMSEYALAKGDYIRIKGSIYPTTGNQRGRLTVVTSNYYMWDGSQWTELPEGYYDVSVYKAEGATQLYPTCDEGMIFAGWFTDDTCETAFVGTEGVAYAKQVAAGILANLAQIPVNTKYDTEVTKMRFVSTVDSEDYRTVGFTIQVEGSSKGPKDIEIKDVYKSIKAQEGGVEYKKTPKDIHEDSEYFFTYTLEDIPNELFGRKIYVTPFWITLDGTKVCGERLAKTVNMGILVNSGENNNYDDDLNGGVDDDESSSGGFTEVEDPENEYGPIS